VDIATHTKADPPVLVEYIRLPDTIATGRYDAQGRKSDSGNLFITVRDTAFLWGVFSQPLKAGQRGEMVFTNAPGTFLVGISFNEWSPALAEPHVGHALFTLISGQRGDGVARVIGRNTHDSDLYAAAGIVLADDASY